MLWLSHERKHPCAHLNRTICSGKQKHTPWLDKSLAGLHGKTVSVCVCRPEAAHWLRAECNPQDSPICFNPPKWSIIWTPVNHRVPLRFVWIGRFVCAGSQWCMHWFLFLLGKEWGLQGKTNSSRCIGVCFCACVYSVWKRSINYLN